MVVHLVILFTLAPATMPSISHFLGQSALPLTLSEAQNFRGDITATLKRFVQRKAFIGTSIDGKKMTDTVREFKLNAKLLVLHNNSTIKNVVTDDTYAIPLNKVTELHLSDIVFAYQELSVELKPGEWHGVVFVTDPPTKQIRMLRQITFFEKRSEPTSKLEGRCLVKFRSSASEARIVLDLCRQLCERYGGTPKLYDGIGKNE